MSYRLLSIIPPPEFRHRVTLRVLEKGPIVLCRLHLLVSLLLPVLMILNAGNAIAETPKERFKRFSVTVSPLMVVVAGLHVATEYRFHRQGSLVVHGGGDFPSLFDNGKISTFAGAQVRHYFPGDVSLGLGYSWWYDRFYKGSIFRPESGEAKTWLVSPLLGRKFVAEHGLTLDFQIGAHFVLHTWNRNPDLRADYDPIIPIVRANVGWSF